METWKNKNENIKRSDLEQLLLGEITRRNEKERIRKEYPEKLENSHEEFIELNRVSSISKPNKIEAFVPDFSLSEEKLIEMGFEKEEDEWHVKNRDWFPNAISENDIVAIYGPGDMGFFSQDEFQETYADTQKYEEEDNIDYIDLSKFEKGQIIQATKAAAGRFVLVPEGTALISNEGEVKTKSGEVVAINEKKDSIYAVSFEEYLKRYMADPTNPTSKKVFDLINEFELKKDEMTFLERERSFQELVDNFVELDRNVKSYKDYLKETDLEEIKSDFTYATEVANIVDKELKDRIDSLDFDERVEEVKQILKEIRSDSSISDEIKAIKESYLMIDLLPKANNHQHLKGSVPKEITLELAKKHNFSDEQIEEIKQTYHNAEEKGFDSLNEFNKAYGTIASAIRTPSDYARAIEGIIESSVKSGQLTVEIRSSVIGTRDEEGIEIDPYVAAENMIDAIDKTKEKLGENAPETSFTFLGYRGRDWHPEEVLEHAKIAVDFAKKYPEKKFAFDIAGPEDTGYAPEFFEESYNLLIDFNKKVESGEIQAEKIGITTHAGETQTYDDDINKKGVDAVREAVKYVDRIGHGLRAGDSKELLGILRDKGIACEMCPTINDKIAGSWESQNRHPAQEFIENGVTVLLSTDNDGIGGTNIVKEYFKLLLSGHGVIENWNNIKKIALDGIKYSFVPEAKKQELEQEFNRRVRIIEKAIKE